MSSCDGWPLYFVDVEHMPDRSMRLWLRDGTSRASLGTVQGTDGLGFVVKQRIADHLGLTDPEFTFQLDMPRPPYVRDGDRVALVEGDGSHTDGVVVVWIGDRVLVNPLDFSLGGGGLIAPDHLIYPDDPADG